MFAELPFHKKLIQFVAIMPVYFIIITVTSVVTRYYIFDHSGISFDKILFGGIFYLIVFMVILTHFKSMCTSPIYVEPGWKSQIIYSKETTKEADHLYCKKCRNPRPPRAHHCKICNKCTLKMDHHCPWVFNCVGFGNQKYFYQFLFYATFGDLIGFIILITRLQNLNSISKGEQMEPQQINSVLDVIWAFMTPIMIIFSAFLAISMTLSIGLLFYFQTKMIIFNQTTIENKIYENIKDSPYYYHDKFHNFKIVMGDSIFEWFLPIRFNKNVYNNGESFTTPNIINQSGINEDNKVYMKLGELELIELSDNKNQSISIHIEDSIL